MEERAISFREMLRRLREDAGLSQRALAQRAGVSEDAVSSVERGVRSPRPETVTRLAQALRLGEQQREALLRAAGHGTGLLPPDVTGITILEGKPRAATLLAEARLLLDTMPTNTRPPHAFLPAGSRMRLGINPLFVGRGEELLQIAAALKGDDATVALGQVIASTGLGGLGKTQLAVEFVHRYGRFFAGGVFWLSFANADEIPFQIAGCAGPAFEARPLEERLELVRRAWQSSLPRLLVFDNCEEETLVEAWRPTSGGCRLLVTSRRSHWSPTLGVTALPLALLPRGDSITLLRRYRPDLTPDNPGIDLVAHELGDLPLALHLAGSYIRAYGGDVSLDAYLAELRQPGVVRHASLLGEGLDDSPSPTHHVQSVAQTFALCLSRLDSEREVDRVAIALLARMAWMAPGQAVPRDLLGRTLEEVGRPRRAAAVRRLGAVGLVEEGEGGLRLHRLLVHFVRQEGLDPDAQLAVDHGLIEQGKAAGERNLTGLTLEAVIPHLVDRASKEISDRLRLATLRHATGLAMWHAGDPAAALPWIEGALQIREHVVGANRLDTAEILMDLNSLLWSGGDIATAWTMAERAMTIHDEMLDSGSIETTEGRYCTASLRDDYGDLTAIRFLVERGLAIRKLVLGTSDPCTVPTFRRLEALFLQGDSPDAITPLLERALVLWDNTYGGDRVRGLYGLARLLQTCGEPTTARPLLERALAISEAQLPPDHPNIAVQLSYLSRLLRDQGDLIAAIALVKRSLAIRERVLGPHHLETAFSLHDLALLFHAQGDPAAAGPLFERALAIRERVLGQNHPDTVATGRALADL